MSISDAGEAMARRRRAFVPCYCFPSTYSADQVVFKERTSFFVLKFAQICRRRFTESSGVSLLTSDADPFSVSHGRSFSPPPSSSTGSSSDSSELISNKESMEVVDNDHESSQIRRVCSPTSTFLLLFFGREPFTEYIQRFIPPLVCFSGSPLGVASLPVSASSSSRRLLHSHSSDVTLGFQLVDQLWALQIMGQFMVMHLMGLFLVLLLMGLRDLKRLPVPPCFSAVSSHVACRFRHSSPIAILVVFNCCASHSPVTEEFDPVIATDWCEGPVSLSFHFRIKTQGNLDTSTLPMLHWSSFAEHLLHCGSPNLPRYQISSCRGQREIVSPPRYQISSCRGQREIVSPPRYQISFCRGQERPLPSSSFSKERTFICERCFSKASFSVISKGSSKRCVVAFDYVAEFWIVSYALVAESISNIRSLLVLFVVHGISSLIASNVVKARRHHDDLYCLRIGIAFIYHIIYCFVVFCLAFVAALLLILMNFLAVTSFSFNGE